MNLRDIKKIKRYGRTQHAHTDNMKTVYPPQTKFAGGITIFGLFESGCFTQVLLHIKCVEGHQNSVESNSFFF